jgi:N-acetylglutamate synthase-like GNAT family acetyltransferase/DNA-binding MarR family transcriptional regulator
MHASLSPMPRPAASEASRLRRTLIDLSRVVLACDREAACCEGVSASGSHALEALARVGPATLNEVAAELFVDKSTASRIVRALEGDGLVQRAADPEDRRALRLSLTAEGEAVLGRIREQALEANRLLLGRYSPEVSRGMVDLLADLVAETARGAGATSASCCAVPASSPPLSIDGSHRERDAVQRLLTGAGLPDTGLGRFPAGWVVVHDPEGEVAATACIERHDSDALLRSVAVRPELRGRGMGRRVVEAALAAASAGGVDRIYLLTTDAAEFFASLGFSPIERSAVPEAVSSSESFAQERCASAQAMVKVLGR